MRIFSLKVHIMVHSTRYNENRTNVLEVTMTPDEIEFLKIIRSLEPDKLAKAIAILKEYSFTDFAEAEARERASQQE